MNANGAIPNWTFRETSDLEYVNGYHHQKCSGIKICAECFWYHLILFLIVAVHIYKQSFLFRSTVFVKLIQDH